MAQDWEPHIWSCSANGNVYYSTQCNPDWQNICSGISSISAGHCGVVCAIESEGVINIRVGISDSKPYGLEWTSLLCEGKHVFVGSRKIVRVTKENKIFAANLPRVIDKSIFLSWYVINVNDGISESNLLSLDINDNLYIASKSGDIFVYVENETALEQSFWKLIITGPKVPQGLLSRLKSYASLGLLSDENNDNVDVCSFLVGEKFMWLIRKNSKEIYQLEFDCSAEESVNSWNRFRLNSKWTIDCICGSKDSMIWAITNDSKLVTLTCARNSVSVKQCSLPSLTIENRSRFRWASASVGYARQLPSRLLQESKILPIRNTRAPPSTLSLYPSLPEHENELTSNGSAQRSGECCDDGSCQFCMDQKQNTLEDSLSPVLTSLQKKKYASPSSYFPGLQFGIKRKSDFANNGDPISNERIILKAKRRKKIKSQLPKLKLLEGIKMSLSPKLKKANHYLKLYNPMTLQATNYENNANDHEKLFDFKLEEECLSGEEPLAMSIPCSEDQEVIMLSSNSSDDNNNIEVFQCSATTSVLYPPGLPTITSVTAHTIATTEILSSPVQVTSLEEYHTQPKDSLTQPASMLSKPFVSTPSIKTPAGAVSTVPSSSPPPASPPPLPSPLSPRPLAQHTAPPPPPPLGPAPPPLPSHVVANLHQTVNSTQSHDVYENEVGFEAECSSGEEIEESVQETMQETMHLGQETMHLGQETMHLGQETMSVQETMHTMQESIPVQETVLYEHFSLN